MGREITLYSPTTHEEITEAFETEESFKTKPIAIDTETFGLNHLPFSIILGNDKAIVYINLNILKDNEGNTLPALDCYSPQFFQTNHQWFPEDFVSRTQGLSAVHEMTALKNRATLQQAFATLPTKHIIFHNAAFDLRVLTRFDMYLTKLFRDKHKVICTMEREKDMTGGKWPKLSACCTKYEVDIPKQDTVVNYLKEHNLGYAYYLVPHKILVKYAIIDVLATYDVAKKQAVHYQEYAKRGKDDKKLFMESVLNG